MCSIERWTHSLQTDDESLEFSPENYQMVSSPSLVTTWRDQTSWKDEKERRGREGRGLYGILKDWDTNDVPTKIEHASSYNTTADLSVKCTNSKRESLTSLQTLSYNNQEKPTVNRVLKSSCKQPVGEQKEGFIWGLTWMTASFVSSWEEEAKPRHRQPNWWVWAAHPPGLWCNLWTLWWVPRLRQSCCQQYCLHSH